MGCGGASRLAAANEAIRTADNSPEAQQLIASVDVTKKGSDGRVPYVQACKFGRTKMVRFMLEHDTKKKLAHNKELVNRGLRANCSGETKADLVEVLMEVDTCDLNYQSAFGESPLTLLACKTDLTSAEVLTQRRLAAVLLIEAGCDMGLPNGDGLTALQVACRDENERMALLLAEKGANIMECHKFMRKEGNERNWVAGSVMSHFAFKYPKFVRSLRRQFMQMFDVNGDGELDREELTHFIASHVKMAFKAGLMPTQEFFDDGSLEIGQIESLLETRCKDMLKGYFAMDKDNDGTYSWEELLPIVKDFYCNLWNQDRPAHADNVDDVDYNVAAEDGGAGAGAGAGGDTEDYGPGLNQPSGTDYGAGTMVSASSRYEVNDDDLPEGWSAVFDAMNDAYYYYNRETRETTWERPT